MLYDISRLCYGLKIIQDGEPCSVISNTFVKPGKGQAFNRVKFRTLISGKMLEKTFKAADYVESANVIEVSSLYLYSDSELWYFMDCVLFDQIIVDSGGIGDNYKWLVEQTNCNITLWNEKPIIVTPPNFVNLKVIYADPGIKGNSITNMGIKLVTLVTGVVIKVPLFVQVGEVIKVDTRSGEYISRIR